MQIRIEGIPVRMDLNGYMLAGLVVFLLGAAIWTVDAFALLPEEWPTVKVAWGTMVGGMALYFLGRVVQMVDMVRRTHSRKPDDEE